ncbi:MAG TPA: hypothetical protein VGC29_02560 [Flavisolibacter sp.]
METTTLKSLKHHLMREALKQNAHLENAPGLIEEDLSGIRELKKKTFDKKSSQKFEGISDLNETANFFHARLIEVITLQLPFEGGTNPQVVVEALSIGSGTSICNKLVSDNDPETGELNLAVVQGQLLDVVYPNYESTIPTSRYTNETCATMGKAIFFDRPYPHPVRVRAITHSYLPSNRESVYFVEPGNLNLSQVGVQGEIYSSLVYKNAGGQWISETKKQPFLNCIKTPEETIADTYLSELVSECEITIPAGVTEFHYGIRTHARAFSSMNITSTIGMDPGNYGLALVDLRSKLRGHHTPIAIRPLTHEFKGAPGGIFSFIVFEIYEG